MGVLGLWEILEQVGHPIKIEGLEGRVLGVDANIWLYKFIRGFREKDNATYSIESHKLGLFTRICKLLFYKIKPVFVFDGPAPVLKRRTLERRQNIRNKNVDKVRDNAMKALANHLKSQYPDANINDLKIRMPQLTSDNLVAAEKLTDEDMELFYLPPNIRNETIDISDDDDYDEDETEFVHRDKVDIHSQDFEQMPPEIRYEILHDIKDVRRRIRNVEALPDDSGSFSDLQLQRLRMRRQIQEKIEKCEKDICSTFNGESVRQLRVQSDPTSTILLSYNNEKKQVVDLEPVPPIETKEAKTKHEQVSRPIIISPRAANTNVDKIRDNAMKALANRLKSQGPDANISDLKLHKPQLTSDNLVEAEELTDEDVELSHLPPTMRNETIDISDDDDDSESDSESEFVDVHVEANDEERSTVSSTEAKEANILHEQVTAETVNAPLVPNKNVEDAKVLPHLPLANDLKPQCPDSNINDPKIRMPLLMSDNLVAAEKLNDNDTELLKLSPNIRNETIDISDDDEEFVKVNKVNRNSQDSDKMPCEILHDIKDVRSQIQNVEALPCDGEKPQVSPTETKEANTLQEQVARPIETISAPRASKVTNKIVEDAKELLRLFGIPYIDAAGEAEAQCAKLEELELTAGTITDDSDIWLFGAKNVYRHFFSDDKYVSQYKMNDIEFHIRMTRENLICFAMLVGSDYTDGIMNIGPVTAIEILSEFQGDGIEPLTKFHEWQERAKSDATWLGKKELKKLLKYRLPEDFPSRAVFDGYLHPMADESSEEFVWGTPELDELREYAHRNFGWDQKRADDRLLPVIKKLNEKKLQRTIDTFFMKAPGERNSEMFRSKRVNQALNRIAKRAARGDKVASAVPAASDVVNLSDDDDNED